MKVAIITIYHDPEAYPPTMNATHVLSEECDKVFLLGRSLMKSEITFPDNVEYIRLNPETSFDKLSELSLFKKIGFFLNYIQVFRKLILQYRPKLVICHDVLAGFAYWIISFGRLKSKTRFWYHSHDVIHTRSMPRFSVLWLGCQFEKYFFKRMNIFSLPVEERKQYFPLKEFKGQEFVIPNYPRIKVFSSHSTVKKLPEKGENIKLLYQGTLGDNHGFENYISALQNKINGYGLTLTLIGKIKPDYRLRLLDLAKELNVLSRVEILTAMPYPDLIKLTPKFHVGLATHKPGERAIYKYGATSSNKIYEYAALGLPLILYDTAHYRKYLEQYSWTTFTDLTQGSIAESIQTLITDYENRSQRAIRDFKTNLNFEKVFRNSWQQIIS